MDLSVNPHLVLRSDLLFNTSSRITAAHLMVDLLFPSPNEKTPNHLVSLDPWLLDVFFP